MRISDWSSDVCSSDLLNPVPAATYWGIWTTTPFGMTSWTHRPLGVMVLNLAYRSGVPWNEASYANPEFDKALDEASAILDVTKRRSEEHTSELQSLMRISYAVFCLKKQKTVNTLCITAIQ